MEGYSLSGMEVDLKRSAFCVRKVRVLGSGNVGLVCLPRCLGGRGWMSRVSVVLVCLVLDLIRCLLTLALFNKNLGVFQCGKKNE